MKRLIVPFLFCNKPELKNYAWIFCKYAEFCMNNDMPIITEAAYCEDKGLTLGYWEGLNPSHWYCTAKSPSEEELHHTLKSILITAEEKKDILVMKEK